MGLITDFWFWFANLCNWMFENTFVPIAGATDWIIFTIAAALTIWWLSKLVYFGNDNEKDYEGW